MTVPKPCSEEHTMADSRIYIITTPTAKHLVEAKTPSQAIRHVTHAGVTYKAASARDVVNAQKEGVTVEVAGAEPADAAA